MTRRPPSPVRNRAAAVLLSRRRLLAAGAALCLPRPARAEITGLRRLAAARGLLFGSMVRGERLSEKRDYADMVARDCSLFVSPFLHWDDVEPRPGVDAFAPFDAEYEWARAHGMQYRGHELLWGEHVPKWFLALPDREAGAKAIVDHVTRVCRHFAGRMQSWDVVNEAVKIAHGRADGLRRTAFLDLVGPQYLDIAFHAAREADPAARLVLNEFDLELDMPRHQRRRRAFLALLDGFKKRGVPIDTVGLQSHLSVELMPHFDDKVFDKLLGELTGRGLEIMITELDVDDPAAPGDIVLRDAQVAAAYRRYLDVALANRAVKAAITWGLSDSDRNLPPRADGLQHRPLPYDADYIPKPAYVAIADALKEAPAR